MKQESEHECERFSAKSPSASLSRLSTFKERKTFICHSCSGRPSQLNHYLSRTAKHPNKHLYDVLLILFGGSYDAS